MKMLECKSKRCGHCYSCDTAVAPSSQAQMKQRQEKRVEAISSALAETDARLDQTEAALQQALARAEAAETAAAVGESHKLNEYRAQVIEAEAKLEQLERAKQEEIAKLKFELEATKRSMNALKEEHKKEVAKLRFELKAGGRSNRPSARGYDWPPPKDYSKDALNSETTVCHWAHADVYEQIEESDRKKPLKPFSIHDRVSQYGEL